jgi:hypothetical protein
VRDVNSLSSTAAVKNMKKNRKIVTVLQTGNQAYFALAKSLLDNEQIRYIANGDLLWRNRLMQLQVYQSDEERVKELLRTLSFDKTPYDPAYFAVTKTKGFAWKVALIVVPWLLLLIWVFIHAILNKK